MNLSKNVKVTLVQAPLESGNGTSNSSGVDMQGFDGVMFVGIAGTIGSGGTNVLTAQDSADNSSFSAISTPAALATNCNAAAKSDMFVIIDNYKPLKRYQRVSLVRATADTEWGGTLAIQYVAKAKPTTHDASTLATTLAFQAASTS